MPLHKQVTTCLKSGGPVSKFCSCNHCTLSVCFVCGAYEGSLTTDCPGETINFDRQKEIYETNLDYSDTRGWHQGEDRWPKETHFEVVGDEVVPRARVDRESLLRDLEQKAIAWARADRDCEDKSAAYDRAKEDEQAKVAFHLADDRAQQCDDEFRQAARKLADAQESR